MTGGVQSATQNRVGAMVGPLQGWDDPAEVQPDEGLTGGPLAARPAAAGPNCVCLAEKK
jgi:hypothetical protein